MSKGFAIFFFTVVLFLFVTNASAQNYIEQTLAQREIYKQAFLTDEHAPLREEDLKDLRFFEPDSLYRVIAELTFIHDEQPFIIPTYSGKEKKYLRFAEANFEIKGEPVKLTLFKSVALINNPQYDDYLFLPFTDPTNDKDTYGGGRYLDLKRSAIKGNQLIIDFNLAYNPYCAYSEGYNCPIPPLENALEIPIEVGEKKFTGLQKDRRH
ncbi:DUF1684 domain-containing protein [Olivibacter sp. CPCC 100613]|uniref:DUF1684 domain-containing protein n=1 Tax=Olivibacter sp. CPCC 100613 TaxID=3079931 RepID=UPI002FF76F27